MEEKVAGWGSDEIQLPQSWGVGDDDFQYFVVGGEGEIAS